MKDLSRLDIPKKTAKDNSQEPQQPKNTKKKDFDNHSCVPFSCSCSI